MEKNDKPDQPPPEGKERSIPTKWILLAILAFVILYHLTLYFKYR